MSIENWPSWWSSKDVLTQRRVERGDGGLSTLGLWARQRRWRSAAVMAMTRPRGRPDRAACCAGGALWTSLRRSRIRSSEVVKRGLDQLPVVYGQVRPTARRRQRHDHGHADLFCRRRLARVHGAAPARRPHAALGSPDLRWHTATHLHERCVRAIRITEKMRAAHGVHLTDPVDVFVSQLLAHLLVCLSSVPVTRHPDPGF
ncbi:hypothetical protein ACTGJ9_018435 [Bradyrhizobium sp. RDM12]